MGSSSSTRGHSLTYPNESTTSWYATFESFVQVLTNYLDNLNRVAITEIEDAATSANIVTFNHVASGAYLQFSNNAAGSGVDIDVLSSNTDESMRITPKGAGKVIIDGISWPNADGSANQYLKTDGAGVLSWATLPTPGITSVSVDTSPALGGNLNYNSKFIVDISGNEVLGFNGAGSAVNYLEVGSSSTGVAVTLSSRGGDTDVDIDIVPKGSGKVTINSEYDLPNTDGLSGQALITNGSGTVTFQDVDTEVSAWVLFDGTTTTINADLGVTSITDNGVGIYAINFDGTTFDNANYALAAFAQSDTTGTSNPHVVSMPSDGSKTTDILDIMVVDDAGAAGDATIISLIFTGGN